jgi:hypothetical protein
MIKASTAELQLHFSILEARINSFKNLTDQYSEHLFGCLNNWYKNSIYHDVSLAHEAVFESLKLYFEHPKTYNPEQGCLKKFLEICVDRTIQKIFEREKFQVHVNSIDHILARHLDNEQDVQLAKLILKNQSDTSAFVRLLDIGSYRIGQQLVEIRRHTDRIKKVLNILPLSFKVFRQKQMS